MKTLYNQGIEDYKFELQENALNILNINDKGKHELINTIVIPPVEYSTDIIPFDHKITEGYTFDFEGLVIITTPNDRKLYHRGKMIDWLKRNL